MYFVSAAFGENMNVLSGIKSGKRRDNVVRSLGCAWIVTGSPGTFHQPLLSQKLEESIPYSPM